MFEVGNIVKIKGEEFLCMICQIEHDEHNEYDGKTYYGVFPVDFNAPTRFVEENRLEKVEITRSQYNDLLAKKKIETDWNNLDSVTAYNEFARIMRKCIVEG